MALSPAKLSQSCRNRIINQAALMNSTDATLPIRDRVQDVINLIRPAVQADGGDIELVNVTDDGTVQIRFHGACHGCPSSNLTLQMGIERSVCEQVPQVRRVVPVD
jgi:Fe-S cluster biogenesis protein NfuA